MKECTREDNGLYYNHFIIGAFDDFVRQPYIAIESYEGVYIPKSPIGDANFLLKALHKIHWSAKLNSKIKLPFKRIWFKKMCVHEFGNDKPVCYHFLGGQYIAGNNELKAYIRRLNPENKIIIGYGDLISKKHYKDFEIVRNSADLISTYDREEAEKYNILFSGKRTYSRVQEITEPDHFDVDVYFLGYAKNRLDTILSVYRYLTENGLKCRFDLAEVPADRQQPLEGIAYISPIPYPEAVRRMNEAKCVLEICQSGSSECTMRMVESIAYHRLLLTNADVRNSEYYHPQTMIRFQDPSDIDTDALKKPIPYSTFENTDQLLSPLQNLKYFDKRLAEKRG